MESPRISVARALELGVRVSWREAVAIVQEAVARTAVTGGATPTRVTAESCLLTRGGDVVLTGTAVEAGPEAVVRLLDDLLASCINPGRFSGAVANGTALEMIEELREHTTAKRRRVEVASVALRGLAAQADAARAMADAAEQDPAADLDDDFIAAPTPAASPPDLARPWVAGLVPPPASPMLDDQTVALLGDFAVGDAEVRRPGLDEVAPVSLRELVAAANAAADVAHAMAGADEQHPLAGVDDVIGAPTPAASPPDLSWSSVTALAPPSAIPMLDDQRVARLGDFAVGDAQVRRPGLDEKAPVSLHELVAVANAAADAARAMADAAEQDPGADLDDDFIAAPTPAASPTDLARPWIAALAPPPASPTIHDQTVALLGDSDVGSAGVRRAGADHGDLIAAVEAAREWTAPEDAAAAPAIGASPAQDTRPSVTPPPAWFSMDLPSAKPQVDAVWTAKYARSGYSSPFDRMRRASPAALVCSVLALAAGGILGLQLPETRWSAVEPSEPAIEPPEVGAPVGFDRQTPLARPDPALLTEVADPPSVPPLVAQNAPRGSPKIEDRRAPIARAKESLVRSMPPPAARPETPAATMATGAGSRSLPTASAADAILAPAAANAAGAPLPAVDLSSVVASPSATASSSAETLGSASTDAPANAVARSSGRELEARAIENVLGRYRIAFNKLDAGAAVAVWPTVNEKTLARAFERLESHEVSFETCQIEIFAVLAEAACSGSTRYVPKVGSRTPKDEARRWRFSLRKASGGWLIDRVDAR